MVRIGFALKYSSYLWKYPSRLSPLSNLLCGRGFITFNEIKINNDDVTQINAFIVDDLSVLKIENAAKEIN